MGQVNNSIAKLAQNPAAQLARALGGPPYAMVVDQPYVAPVIERGVPGRKGYVAPSAGAPAFARRLTPIETAQVGVVWRICRRKVFLLNGASWD